MNVIFFADHFLTKAEQIQYQRTQSVVSLPEYRLIELRESMVSLLSYMFIQIKSITNRLRSTDVVSL